MNLVAFWPVGGPQPLTLTVEATSSTVAALSWSDRSGGRARYEIRRGGVLINTTAAGAQSYNDTAATPGATHEYEVRAVAPYWNAVAGPVDSVVMPTTETGLLFPDYNVSASTNKMIAVWNAAEGSSAPFAIYPAAGATYIWRAMPRQKLNEGYWSSLFRTEWTSDWDGNAVLKEYYCCHPYPDPTDERAEWEISMNGDDFRTVPVVYDQWYQQVVTVSAAKAVTFYFDWPNTGAGSRVGPITQDSRSAQTNPAMYFGDTRFNVERYRGVLRGFQYYDALLTTQQITDEIASPGSVRTPWYLNLNPTPDDISDKSGNGHNPKWFTVAKPTLWEAA